MIGLKCKTLTLTLNRTEPFIDGAAQTQIDIIIVAGKSRFYTINNLMTELTECPIRTKTTH